MRPKIVLLILIFSSIVTVINAQIDSGKKFAILNRTSILTKKILIVTDSVKNISLPATVEAREFCNLLGHFKTSVTILGLINYSPDKIIPFYTHEL